MLFPFIPGTALFWFFPVMDRPSLPSGRCPGAEARRGRRSIRGRNGISMTFKHLSGLLFAGTALSVLALSAALNGSQAAARPAGDAAQGTQVTADGGSGFPDNFAPCLHPPGPGVGPF